MRSVCSGARPACLWLRYPSSMTAALQMLVCPYLEGTEGRLAHRVAGHAIKIQGPDGELPVVCSRRHRRCHGPTAALLHMHCWPEHRDHMRPLSSGATCPHEAAERSWGRPTTLLLRGLCSWLLHYDPECLGSSQTMRRAIRCKTGSPAGGQRGDSWETVLRA